MFQVKVGGSVQSVTSIRNCQASLGGFAVEEVDMCLMVEASASVKASAATKVEKAHCKKDTEKMKSMSSFSSVFSDR